MRANFYFIAYISLANQPRNILPSSSGPNVRTSYVHKYARKYHTHTKPKRCEATIAQGAIILESI